MPSTPLQGGLHQANGLAAVYLNEVGTAPLFRVRRSAAGLDIA